MKDIDIARRAAGCGKFCTSRWVDGKCDYNKTCPELLSALRAVRMTRKDCRTKGE